MDSTTTTTTTTTGKSYQWKKAEGDILYPNTEKPYKQYGWVCPLCGRANAPWVSQCPCQPITTTWSGPIWSSPDWTYTTDHTTTTE